MKRYVIGACAFALSWSLLLTPAIAKSQLVIGITQFPSTFHPSIDSMLAKSYVHGFTRRPITAYGPDWNLMCMLCEELPTLENGRAVPETAPGGKKGMAVTYTLLDAAQWGDGKPVTTEDVRFTWEAGRQGKTGIVPVELYRSAYKLDIKDAKTFTLHFDKRTFNYNDLSSFRLLPAHVDRLNFQANPEAYKTKTAFDTDITNEGLYLGPYVISEVERGAYVVLERNPNWWGKPPTIDRIVVKVVPNTAALEANLLSGGIDMIAGELGLSIDQALSFEKRNGAKYQVIYKPGLIYEHIDLNLDNPLLQDKRVRQALLLSIDRTAISERLFGGRQPVAHSGVNPLDWVFDPEGVVYAYDPNAAKRLLAEAGYKMKVKGVLVHEKTDAPLRLEIMTTAGNKARELVQQVLQSQWKAVGIDVRIKNEPARVFFGQTVTQRRYDAMAMYAWISSPESVPRTSLHSAHIPTADNGYAGQNYPGFKNTEMDRLIEQIEVELDRPKRQEMWHRLQEIYATELPVLPLYFRANSFILPKSMTGLVPTGHQFPTSLWVEDWRLP